MNKEDYISKVLVKLNDPKDVNVEISALKFLECLIAFPQFHSFLPKFKESILTMIQQINLKYNTKELEAHNGAIILAQKLLDSPLFIEKK